MNETETHKDKSTAELEKCLRYFKIRIVRSARDPKFILEIVTLIIFVIYAIYTGRMYYANRDAADAATSAAKTADQTMRLDERAWVAVTAVNSKEPPQLNHRFTFSVHFVDTGKTPARNVIVHPNNELLAKGQRADFSPDPKPERLGVLSPGSDRTIENGLDPTTIGASGMTKSGLDYLKTRTLSVHGTITYDDIFGCHHWITYCATLKDDWSGYSFCSENNDTDPIQSCHGN